MDNIWDESKVELATTIVDYYVLDGILIGKIKPVKHSVENINESYVQLNKFLNNQKTATYIDVNNLLTFGNKERTLYKSKAEEFFTKIAVFSSSPARNVMVNVYLGLTKPQLPIRLFHNSEKALIWLKNEK